MSINPKNISKLLCKSFDHPQYDIESITTSGGINFALQLEDLIKDAIDSYSFIESYTT